MRKVLIRGTVAVVLALVALRLPPARAAEGGASNYVPGSYGDFGMAVAPTGKLTLRNDVYYYGADVDRTVRSGRAEIGADVDFVMNFTTLLYKPGLELFGGQYACGVFVPVVHADINSTFDAGGFTQEDGDTKTALGDIALIPAALFWNTGNVHLSLSQLIVTPTGDYDVDDVANTGLNYWSFDSNVAVTYLNPDTGQDYSVNLGYIYNTENDDTDYQTGQEVHIDIALNQFLSETFAVGIQGFYLKQITGDSGDGAVLGGFKGEALGVGPAAMWSTRIGRQDITFIAKWLIEVDTEHRMEGDHVYFSFAMDW